VTVLFLSVALGASISTKYIGTEYISVGAMSQHSCEWFLIILCCYSGYGPLTKRSVPLDVSTVHSNAAVQLRSGEILFIFNWNINNTPPPSYFVPLFYTAVTMIEEVHVPLTLRRWDIIYVTFTSYVTHMQETTCFALQVKRPSSLPTVRDQMPPQISSDPFFN